MLIILKKRKTKRKTHNQTRQQIIPQVEVGFAVSKQFIRKALTWLS